MTNKKAQYLSMNVIIISILALMILVILSMIFINKVFPQDGVALAPEYPTECEIYIDNYCEELRNNCRGIFFTTDRGGCGCWIMNITMENITDEEWERISPSVTLYDVNGTELITMR
jgi:hypothetical protein